MIKIHFDLDQNAFSVVVTVVKHFNTDKSKGIIVQRLSE